MSTTKGVDSQTDHEGLKHDLILIKSCIHSLPCQPALCNDISGLATTVESGGRGQPLRPAMPVLVGGAAVRSSRGDLGLFRVGGWESWNHGIL